MTYIMLSVQGTFNDSLIHKSYLPFPKFWAFFEKLIFLVWTSFELPFILGLRWTKKESSGKLSFLEGANTILAWKYVLNAYKLNFVLSLFLYQKQLCQKVKCLKGRIVVRWVLLKIKLIADGRHRVPNKIRAWRVDQLILYTTVIPRSLDSNK
jgi:hypothetical protein